MLTQWLMAKRNKQFRRTFIREWRKYRNLNLVTLAERIPMTASALSMLERGLRGYSQETLEKLAEELQTDAASLLIRNPTTSAALWSIWDNASEGEREQIVEIAQVVKRTGTRR